MSQFTNNLIIKMQAKAVYLCQLLAVRQDDLAKRKKQNFYATRAERIAAQTSVSALSAEVDVIDAQYREAMFNLMVSGISNAGYQHFVDQLEGPCLVWNQ